MAKRPFTRYQHRMTKLVWAWNAYLIACPIILLYFGASVIGWVVYFSTATLNYCIAAGLDAVFDSLSERTNIQSSWLDTRLSVLEGAFNTRSGQDVWRENAVLTNDPAHYYESYPERVES